MSTNSNLENLEKEADQLEREAKIKSSQGEYSKAIDLLKKAKTINQKLGFQGKINMIEKKIQQTQNLIEYQKSSNTEYTPTFQQINEKRITSISSSPAQKTYSKSSTESSIDPEKQKERELIKSAEEALDRGNKCIQEKDFIAAKRCYEESIEIFRNIGGWERQVQILEKELDNIDDYAEQHKKASKPTKSTHETKSYPSSMNMGISSTRTSQNINTYTDIKEKSSPLSSEERRRKEIRERTEERIRQAEEARKRQQRMSKRQKIVSEKKQRALETRMKMEEKKQNEEKLIKEAEKFLEQAKNQVDNKQFDDAKGLYRMAIKKFKELGWFSQVDNLYDEVKNLEQYKLDHFKKQREEEERRKKQRDAFQKRIQDVKLEKEKEEKRRLEQIRSLSPDEKKKLEKARLLLDKAEKEEGLGKTKRAIGRYNLILDLYNSLPKDKINLSNDIVKIKKTISDLESKI
ncbi:MAG: hypothetical protein GF311_14590 [Candidatus Lokiarchaeota archaeon]|nr:hypothetical protein [Candidatus Lokiarchaeota archaeon]